MDQNFRKRQQQTLCSGELDSEHSPLALTELVVEFYQDLSPSDSDHVDLETASTVSSQETVSPASMVMSMIYARRLQRKRPDHSRRLSSSDLFLISMMMASKYLYDEGVDEEVFNDEWAENAGVDKEEINKMELDFLDALEWELFIRKEDFEQAMLSVEKNIALKEGLKRGWFSYTDLCLLLEDLSLSHIGMEWLKVIIISAAVYCVGVMALVGSSVLIANTACTLASSGLTPGLLSNLYTTGLLSNLHTIPAVLQGLPSAPSFSHFVVLESLKEVPQPTDAVFRNNETEDGLKENKTPASASEKKDRSAMPEETMVDTIMSQLMTVLAFKSQVVQFVQAVSDSYTERTRKNHSWTRLPHSTGCDDSVGNIDCLIGKETEGVSAVASSWLDLAGSSSELDTIAELCLHCDKRWSVDNIKVSCDSILDTNFLMFCRKWCSEDHEHNKWLKGQVRQCCASCQYYRNSLRLLASSLCDKKDMTSLRSTFPDVIIGFSTSMPPPVGLYAT